MKSASTHVQELHTVTECLRFLGLPAPTQPLFGLVDLDTIYKAPQPVALLAQLYLVALGRGFAGTLRYGHQTYAFEEGGLLFVAPGQLLSADAQLRNSELSGWLLVFHPDLVARYPLAHKLGSYAFFSYEVHEVLPLAPAEEHVLAQVLEGLKAEYEQPCDSFTQELLVAQLDVLFGYANRFYHHRFAGQRTATHDLLSRFEALLTAYFTPPIIPLPTVQHFAEALHVSPTYLSELLRKFTGQTAQQHLHRRLIEKAKQQLLSSALSINEIAFQLGFEYPTYFSRLFKEKTGLTPTHFRAAC